MKNILITGALLLGPMALSAQSGPPGMKAKQAATAAVNAANARTQAAGALPADTAITPPASAAASAPIAERPMNLDTAGHASTLPPVAGGRNASFERETFLYSRLGRRDPFVSLMTTSDLRPLISDLRLVAIAYDPNGRNSVAILHDVTGSKQQYRIRVGQSLGRMRVAAISPKKVLFTIEEFGYSRQESLTLGDSNTERKQ